MQRAKRLLNLWVPVIVWAGVIFYFSSRPTIETTDFFLGDFLIKKTAHLVEYGIFAILFFRALVSSNVSVKKAMLFSVVASFLYAVTDEFHQSFTPGRGPKFTDVLIDTTGATLSIYGIVGKFFFKVS